MASSTIAGFAMYKSFAAIVLLFAIVMALMADNLPKGDGGNIVQPASQPDNAASAAQAPAPAVPAVQATPQALPTPDMMAAPVAGAATPTLTFGNPAPAQPASEPVPAAAPATSAAPAPVVNPIPTADQLPAGRVLKDTRQTDPG